MSEDLGLPLIEQWLELRERYSTLNSFELVEYQHLPLLLDDSLPILLRKADAKP